jgi:ParB family transcriptional regulator, chromosome partitioning protein
MTSGQFHLVPLGNITVKRDERQRRELTDIDVLADSINRLGLIHPIVVTRDLELVAGERRHTACTRLGWDTIPVQYVDELDPLKLEAIELEENIKRQDITWQDQVNAVARWHALRIKSDPTWTQSDTAGAIGFTKQHVNRLILVSDELASGNQMVADAPKLSTALGIAERARERRDEAQLNKLHDTFGVRQDVPLESILTEDFTEWALGDTPWRFNLIHCDFPYGIGADEFNQGGARAHGGYADTQETWEKLMFALEIVTKTMTAPSCHLMFWFAMRKADERLYEPTARALERIGWDINPQPLIWMKSDGAGILPDPERGPRQIYETCLFGSRGDRKIVRAVANAYAAPTVRERHMSEKPEPMLRHFFGMLVDENTVMLDPTCGSGSSLRAAESLGAKHVLGLEINPEFAGRAREALRRSRKLKEAVA